MRPKESPFTIESVTALLRGGGLRITKGRLGILGCLFHAKNPLSLREIQDAAKRHSGIRSDYSTVFRMIALMENLHLVHKVNLRRPCSYYELHNPRRHYDHLVCRICGSIVLLDIPCPLRDAQTRIEKIYGFQDLSHSLEFFGRCPACCG